MGDGKRGRIIFLFFLLETYYENYVYITCCDKNLVEHRNVLGWLAEKGYQFTDDEQEAEIVVVNTCCFIGDAKEESTIR